MKEREPLVATALVVLLLLLWVGFVFHQSDRFAGSFTGGMFALSGAALMLVPLLYMVIKRISWLKQRVLRIMTMRTFLAIHIYAGIVGPILVLIHTGHKFESTLGILLTALTLIVVMSGFIGRYLMKHVSAELREKKEMLKHLQSAYQEALVETRSDQEQYQRIQSYTSLVRRFFLNTFVEPEIHGKRKGARGAIKIVEAMADVEYSIKTHDTLKTVFKKWLKIHIVISMILYLGMALHVWSAIHFGIRWFA